ncbi:MAG: Fur family transcriptional regulator [Clostridiales bacterium]|jgi:Mn-dependent DtxR family transcriptional regulator|nr:Fur family transcriptional regulator [Clostridiales bacterium]
MPDREFYTFSEYIRKDQDALSPSAEDYMEMIYRLTKEQGFTRVNDLAGALNVQPPSVTKMIQKLSEMKLIKYEKYGVIMLEREGIALGKALLYRHNLIEEFLRLLNITEGLLAETEKMEHTINDEILKGIKDLLEFFQMNPELRDRWNQYRRKNIDKEE